MSTGLRKTRPPGLIQPTSTQAGEPQGPTNYRLHPVKVHRADAEHYWLKDGDVGEVEIPEIGVLRNRVRNGA